MRSKCGQPLLYLAGGLQGGQKLTAEPVDDGQIRVIIEHVNPETPNAPGQDVASYFLLPEDVAARARERGERLLRVARLLAADGAGGGSGRAVEAVREEPDVNRAEYKQVEKLAVEIAESATLPDSMSEAVWAGLDATRPSPAIYEAMIDVEVEPRWWDEPGAPIGDVGEFLDDAGRVPAVAGAGVRRRA